MKVQAKTSFGPPVQVEVHSDDTFSSLRSSLSQATQIPPEFLRIIHKGQLVVPGMKVSDMGVQDGDVLVVLRGRTKPEPTPPDLTPEPDPVSIRQAIAKSKGVDEKDVEDEDDEERVPFQELLNSFLGNFFAQPPGLAPAARAPALPIVNVEPPAEAVAQLTEMGFTEAQARRALKLNRMSIPQATDWLLEHSDDAEPAGESGGEQGEGGGGEGGGEREGARGGGGAGSGSAVVGEGGGVPVPAPPLFQGNRASAEQRLLEMGFSSDDVARALRATGNNYEAACALLVGEADEENPLDEDSPIVGAIFSNPVVSAGLSNPRVMQAFRAMVEDPTTVANYISDPEVGPLILQVHSILQGLTPNFNP